MGKCIVKLAENEYVEWSTVVDAPITYAVPRREAVREWGADRIEAADRWGTSMLSPRYSLNEVLWDNRAGPSENNLSFDELRHRFRRWHWWHWPWRRT